jgi:hypothetical protein
VGVGQCLVDHPQQPGLGAAPGEAGEHASQGAQGGVRLELAGAPVETVGQGVP